MSLIRLPVLLVTKGGNVYPKTLTLFFAISSQDEESYEESKSATFDYLGLVNNKSKNNFKFNVRPRRLMIKGIFCILVNMKHFQQECKVYVNLVKR